VGGVLLITPGVLTDVVGLLLLVPLSRHWVAARVRHQLEHQVRAGRVQVFSMGGFSPFGHRREAASPSREWKGTPGRPQASEDAQVVEEPEGRH
jgi:UPF0716 family protein affecting phage T7 exclusion